MNAIPAVTGLNGKGLSAFLAPVEIDDREQSRESITAARRLKPTTARRPAKVTGDHSWRRLPPPVE